MTLKAHLIIFLWLGLSCFVQAQRLPEAEAGGFINFDYRIFDSQPVINACIESFTQETSIPVTVVLTYGNHPQGYSEFRKKWSEDRKSKGVLIILNPFARELWENYVDIVPSSTVHIATGDIDNLLKLSVIPLMENKPWVNQETGAVSPEIFSQNQRIIEAVKHAIFGLRSVAHVKNGVVPVPSELANADGSFTFITPAGEKIVLPNKVGNVSFFQKVTNDDDRQCVVGTLAAFRLGYDHYQAVFNNGVFSGYKAGNKTYPKSVPGTTNAAYPDVIMGIVCTEFFKYMKFNATELSNPGTGRQGQLSFYSGTPQPVLMEKQFPIRIFSDGSKLVKEVRSRGHEHLQMTQLGKFEYQLVKDRCDRSEILSLLKLAQLAGKYEGYFSVFIRHPEHFFNPVADWQTFKGLVVRENTTVLGDWVTTIDGDPELQKIYSTDKTLFYALTIEAFYKYLMEGFVPPVLVDGGNFVFATPSGHKVVLPKRAKSLKFFYKAKSEAELDIVLGTLMGFKLDDKIYEAVISGGVFKGYQAGSLNYTAANSASGTDDVVMGFPDSKGGLLKDDFNHFRLVRFKAAAMSYYTAGNTPIRPITDFPILPFSPACPVVSELKITSEQLKSQPLVVYEPDFNDQEKSVINSLKSQPGLLAAFTAAQYNSQYPVLSDIFTRHFNEWGSTFAPGMYYWDDVLYWNKGLQAAWQNDKHTFYVEYLQRFKAHVDKWHNFTKKEFLSRLAKSDYLNIPHWDVTLAMKKFTPNDYKALKKEERIALLRLLTRQELMGGTYEAPEALPFPVPIKFSMEGGETTALKIIEGTPETDRPYILDRLVDHSEGRVTGDRRFLIHALCEDFDGKEFEDFVQTIVNWVKKHKPAPKSLTLDAVVEESSPHFKKAMPFDHALWTGSSVTKHFSNDGKVTLNTRYDRWTGEITYDSKGEPIAVFENISHTVAGGPYDYFVLEFKKPFETENETYKKGQRVTMPILYGYLLFNQLNGKRLQKGSKLAVDIFLIAVGVGELRAGWSAASALGKVRLLVDNGINIGGAIMSQGLEDELKKSNHEAAQNFLKAWSALNFYSNVGSLYTLGESFIKALGKLRDSGLLTHATHQSELNWLKQRVEAELNVRPVDAPNPFPSSTMPWFGLTSLDNKRVQMSPEIRALFDATFASSNEHLRKFNSDIDLVDAWSIVKDDDAFKIRFTSNDPKNFDDLQKIAQYLKKNDAGIARLTEELGGIHSTSAKGEWVRGLDVFSSYRNIEDKLKTLDPKFSVAFRNDYNTPAWAGMREAFDGNPALIDAWKLLRKHNPNQSNVFIFNSKHPELLEDLRRVSDHISFSGRPAAEIEAEFDALSSFQARREWINRLPVYSGNYPNIAKKVNSLDPEMRASFWSDFGGNADKLQQIEQKGSSAEAMIDAWLIIRSNSGSRTDITALSALADYITQRKHTDKVHLLRQEFEAITDKDGWLRSIPFYSKFPGLDEKLFSLTVEQRIAFRADFKGAAEDVFRSFDQDLFQVEAWRLLSGYASGRTKSAHLKRIADHVRVNADRIKSLDAELHVLKDLKDERNVPLDLDTWLDGLALITPHAKLETKLSTLAAPDRIKFRHDAGRQSPSQAPALLAAFNKDTELIDGWLILSDHGPGRMDLQNVQAVSAYRTRSGKEVAELRTEYRAIGSEYARVKWIEGLSPRWIKEEVIKLTGEPTKLRDTELEGLVSLGKSAHQFTDEDMLAFALLHKRKFWISADDLKLVIQTVADGRQANRGRFKGEWNYMKVYREVQRRAINGQILDPAEYLDAAFYAAHLRNFHGRASYLLTETQYKAFIEGKDFLGRPSGLVVATKAEIDRVIKEAGTSVAELERLLGFSPGWWQNKGRIYRVDVINPENQRLRFQNGTEDAANEFYQPGGFTSGGVMEAVTDRIPNNCMCADINPLPQFGGVYHANLEGKLSELASRLGKSGGAVKNQFDAEFRGSAAHLEAFDRNPAMIEAWFAVKDYDPILKGDIPALQTISNYMNRNASRVDAMKAELASVAAGGDAAKRDWLNGLSAFTPFEQLEAGIASLDASLRIAIRNDFKSATLKNFFSDLQKAAVEDAGLFDAWIILRDVPLPSVRHNVDNMKRIRAYLMRTGEPIESLKTKVPSYNVQQWINGLEVL